MSRRQFFARMDPKPTLWEDGEICPHNPEMDVMMRLLRAEARDLQLEKSFQALTKAMLGATITVSDDEVSFWTPDGESLRAPVLENLLVTPTVERAVVGITKGWRDGIADELRQMTLQRGNRRADPREQAQVANQISAICRTGIRHTGLRSRLRPRRSCCG